jgi:hypothetical protein
MFPKEVVETKEQTWDEYYAQLRHTMKGKDHNLRRETLLWAIVKLQFEILLELKQK